MTWSGRSFTTYPNRNAVLRHALVGTQLFHMCWSRWRFTTCPVGTQFYDMPWSGQSFMTYPDRNAVLRYDLVRTQFYDVPESERSFTTCPGRDAFIPHVLVTMQIYDMPWSGRSYSTCPGHEADLRHALVGTQLFHMSWSQWRFTTCPVGMQFYDMPYIVQSVARWTLTSNGCGFEPHNGRKVDPENLNVTIRGYELTGLTWWP